MKLTFNKFFSFLIFLFILFSLSLFIKVPSISATACNSTNYTGSPYCVPSNICQQDGGHSVGGSCTNAVCCCPSGTTCSLRNPTSAPTQTSNVENGIFTSTNNSNTNWRVNEAYYYTNSFGARSHFGPVVKDSNPTGTWFVNRTPKNTDSVTWYTACVDPSQAVDVSATVVHAPDCPGGHCYIYLTNIDVACHNMGYNGTPNRVYAGCGTNYTNNFGTVGPQADCPTNSCYCNSGGDTSYSIGPNNGNCCVNGTKYCAANGYSCGNPPRPTSPPPSAPNAPNVSDSTSCNNSNNPVINLDWNAVNNANSYDVDYKRSNSGTWISGANNTTNSAYNITGITEGVNYDWRVRSNGSGGSSGYATGQIQSATCSVPPPPCPGGISASTSCNANNSAYIDVSWNNSAGASSYDVRYRASGSTSWINNPGVTSSFRIPTSAVNNNTNYDYQVRALNSGGNSGWCPNNANTIKTSACTPNTQDLIVSTFNFPGGLDTGNSNPTVIIKNIGNTTVTNAFYVAVDKGDGSAVKQSPEITSNVGANGGTLDVSQYFTGMARPAANTYTAVATADYRNNIVESNENNNTSRSTYTTTPATTNLTVHIYYDYNGNGVQNTNDDNAASQGFTVNNGTNVRTTNNTGNFTLTNLAAGNYDIHPVLLNGNWTITTPITAIEPGTSIINIGIRPPAPTCSGGLVANPTSGNPPFNSTLTAVGCTTPTGGTPNYSWPAPDYGTTDDVNNRTTTWHSTPDTYTATTIANPVVTVCNTGAGNVACRSYTTPINVIPLFSISGNVYLDTSPQDQIKNNGESNITGAVSIARSPASGNISTKTDGTAPTYTINNLPAGTYRVSYSPSGYTMTYPLNGPPPQFSVTVGSQANCNASIASINSAQCTNGNISNLNFGVTNSVAWIQSGGSDIWVQDGVNNNVPSGATCGSTPTSMSTDKNGTPGIIYSGNGAYDFCPPSVCQDRSSSQQWVVGGLSYPEVYTPSTPGVIKTSFAYLSAIAAKNGVNPIPSITSICGGNLSNCSLPSSAASFPSGIYIANGDLHITSDTNIPSGKNYIILVKGDLYLQKEIHVPAGSTLLFSVGKKSDGTGGNIHVAASVGNVDYTDYSHMNLEGWYSADDSFIIDGGNTCPTAAERLNVAGAIVVNAALEGGNFDYSQRSLCTGNLTCPVFYITERPDFTLNAPSFLQVAPRIWQEVAP